MVNFDCKSKIFFKNLIEKLKTPINKVAIELNEIVDKNKLKKLFKNKDKMKLFIL